MIQKRRNLEDKVEKISAELAKLRVTYKQLKEQNDK